MYRYFKTKKQHYIDQESQRQKKRLKEIEKESEEESWWIDYFKRKEERDTLELNSVYKTLRYFILADATVENYVKNYGNEYLRQRRVLFLEEEHTNHDFETKKHIDEVLSKRS